MKFKDNPKGLKNVIYTLSTEKKNHLKKSHKHNVK